MLSPNFDGHCSYCRIVIVDPTRLKTQHPVLTAILTNFEIVCLFEGQISADGKTALLNIFRKSLKSRDTDEAQSAELQNYNRLMMLWEELLNSVHDDALAPEPQREPDVRAPRINQPVQFVLEPQEDYTVRDAHVGLLFYLEGIAVGLQTVLFWDLYHGGTREVLLETMATIRNYLCVNIIAWIFYRGSPIPLVYLLLSMLLHLVVNGVLVASFVGPKSLASLIL